MHQFPKYGTSTVYTYAYVEIKKSSQFIQWNSPLFTKKAAKKLDFVL